MAITQPTAPLNLKAIPLDGKVLLIWDKPGYIAGNSLISYIIAYTPTPNKIDTNSDFTNYILPLTNGTTYHITVAAKNDLGLVGNYSIPVIVTPQSQTSDNLTTQRIYKANYNKFNDVAIPGIDSRTTSGLMNISRSNTTSIYTSPGTTTLPVSSEFVFTDCYPTITVGNILFRTAKRKISQVYNSVDISYSYSEPTGTNNSVSLLNKEAIYRTLEMMYPASFMQDPNSSTARPISIRSLISATYLNKFLLTGSISDAVKLYNDAIIYKKSPVKALYKDKGLEVLSMWEENKVVAINTTGVRPEDTYSFKDVFASNWAYEYIHSRPILTFDTTSFLQERVSSAQLNFRKVLSSTVANADKISIEIYSSSKVYNPTTKSIDYNDYISAVTYLGTISLNDQRILSGETVPIDIPKEAILAGSYTTFILKSSLEANNILPTGWNQIWLEDVYLDIQLNNGVSTRPTGPMAVERVTANAGVSKASISWTPPLNDGGSSITYYLAEETTTKTSILCPQNTLSAVFENLTYDKPYTFSVKVINDVDVSSERTTAIATSTTNNQVYDVPDVINNLTWVVGSDQVDLSWSAPIRDGGKPILNYLIRNSIDSTSRLVGSNPGVQRFTNLQSNKPLKYRVSAINSLGEGRYKETDVIIPAGVINIPDTVTNVRAVPYGLGAKVSWTAASDGGSPITMIRVTAYPDKEAVKAIYMAGSNTSCFFPNLSLTERYRFTVIAISSKGQSLESKQSNPIIISNSNSFLQGVYKTEVPTVISVEAINYKKFFIAPIDLNFESPNYREFLYPKTVNEYVPSYIQGEVIDWPVTIASTNNRVIFTISSTPATVVDFLIPENENYAIDSLDDSLSIVHQLRINAPGYNADPALSKPLYDVDALMDKLIIKCLTKNRVYDKDNIIVAPYDNIELTFIVNNVEVPNLAYTTIFGSNPITLTSTVLPKVENHIPTVEYDFKHEKALVEARPYRIIREKDITKFSSFETTEELPDSIKFLLTTGYRYIRPGSVTIIWRNENNEIVEASDYIRDGRLLIRLTNKNLLTDQISFQYLPSWLDTSQHYGLIDYTEGTITDMTFSKLGDEYIPYNYAEPALIGQGVKFPVTLFSDKKLYIRYNNNEHSYPVPVNTYGVDDIVTHLNTHNEGEFQTEGFFAYQNNGQLVITVKNLPAPNKNISFSTTVYTDNAQLLLFGLKPIIRNTPKINVTLAYTSYVGNEFNYIWYQTPHFVIKLKNNSTQYFTQSHNDYILSKIPLIKPAETVFDKLELEVSIEEKITVTENEDPCVTVYDGIIPPYLICSNLPPVPFSLKGTFVNVRVTNPDGQDNTKNQCYGYY